MVATRRNPDRTFPPSSVLPPSPVPGQGVSLLPLGVNLSWDGTRWGAADGSAYMQTVGTGLFVGAAVLEVAGLVELCDPSAHSHLDGVVEGILGPAVLVREQGLLDGLAGLVDGAHYFVGAAPGTLSTTPAPARHLHVGWARGTTGLIVRPGTQGIG